MASGWEAGPDKVRLCVCVSNNLGMHLWFMDLQII